MILTVLVGNTNTRLAWFRGRRLCRRRVVPTAAVRRSLRALPAPGPVSGIVLASVVPALTSRLARALRAATGLEPMPVTPRTRTGLSVRYDRRQLGADRLAAAVGAHARYRGDLLVIDFGTATTLNVVLAGGEFPGGSILPGVDALLASLAASTAQLPRARPVRNARPLARTTEAAIRAGVLGLFEGGLDRLIRTTGAATGRHLRVVATGGRARFFRRLLGRDAALDPDLASRGLAELYRLNRQAAP